MRYNSLSLERTIERVPKIMSLPLLLAHGALGDFDEVIYLSAAFIFLCIMGVQWVISRNTHPKFESNNEKPETGEHFRLE